MSVKTGNVFAALNTKRSKKKKGDKEHKKKRTAEKKPVTAAELERAIFSQPQLSITSWADEEDDDFDALQELPARWSQTDAVGVNGSHSHDQAQGGGADDSEEEVDIETELGVELGHDDDDEQEEEKEEVEPQVKPASISQLSKVPAEPERQLSKKEIKKKELQELDAVFAEFGIDVDTKTNTTTADGVGKRKKKEKKDKVDNGVNGEFAEVQEEHEEPLPEGNIDPAKAKTRLQALKKKSTDTKKKAVSSTALAEAKLRAKKLGKSKDTTHYNQAPTR